MGQYLPVLAMIVLAGLFAAVSFFASRLLAPRRPTPGIASRRSNTASWPRKRAATSSLSVAISLSRSSSVRS